jgi:hypothetical protein
VVLRSWRVEGSADGVTWQVLDIRGPITDRERTVTIRSYAVTDEGEYRYVRLIDTVISIGYGGLAVVAFELFGYLIRPE